MASAAFSAIIIVGVLVLPPITFGMTDTSTTRRFAIPCTLSDGSTTASGSMPILQVPAGCQLEAPHRLAYSRRASVSNLYP